ncbi:MAG: ABC transporter permease [Coriobacteriaceae bacterium]|nr:ABC transporter permease [Coriobacteriaceae bacterium]MDD7585246.1 ABC transporter permease [Coriobacteriaceae bacterium]
MTGEKNVPHNVLSDAPRPGMARQVLLELRKGRRKHLWLICAAMLGALLMWFGVQSSRQAELTADYRVLLYSLPTVNAIFLPLLSTVVASTVCDVENRANTWKLLLTMERAEDLFCAKWLTCALVLATVVTAEVGLACVIGVGLGFQPVPAGECFVLWVSTLSVCLFVATVIECLCLFIANQFVPLVLGVVLSFLGLFSMYLPPAVSALVPSSYFGLMSTVRMSYDAATGAMAWSSIAWPVGHLATIVFLTVTAFALSLRAFARKEL